MRSAEARSADSPSYATDAPGRVSLHEILAQQTVIRDAIPRHDPPYANLDGLRRSRIAEAQARVFQLGMRAQSAGGLSADDQLTLFNQLKSIEAPVTKKDIDDRWVCERVALTGTRQYQTACMSRADRERRSDEARVSLAERIACTTHACISGN